MSPQLLSEPGFLAGVAGGLFGIFCGAVGFLGSWQAAKSRKEKHGLIARIFVLASAMLVLVGVHCFIQLSVESEAVKTVGFLVYSVVLVALVRFDSRWECRCAAQVGQDGQK